MFVERTPNEWGVESGLELKVTPGFRSRKRPKIQAVRLSHKIAVATDDDNGRLELPDKLSQELASEPRVVWIIYDHLLLT